MEPAGVYGRLVKSVERIYKAVHNEAVMMLTAPTRTCRSERSPVNAPRDEKSEQPAFFPDYLSCLILLPVESDVSNLWSYLQRGQGSINLDRSFRNLFSSYVRHLFEFS